MRFLSGLEGSDGAVAGEAPEGHVHQMVPGLGLHLPDEAEDRVGVLGVGVIQYSGNSGTW